MGSSFTLSQPALLPTTFRVLRHRGDFAPISPSGFRISCQRSHRLFSSHHGRVLEASWIHDGSSNDGYGGWAIDQPETEKGKAIPKFLFVGIGSSVAILLIAISSSRRKGFRYHFNLPFHAFHGSSFPSESADDTMKDVDIIAVEVNENNERKVDDETDMRDDASDQIKGSHISGQIEECDVTPMEVGATIANEELNEQDKDTSVTVDCQVIPDDVTNIATTGPSVEKDLSMEGPTVGVPESSKVLKSASEEHEVSSKASPEQISALDDPSGGKKHIIIPVAADSTQMEALSVLKKLKIIENDVKSEDLCTRRQYARWLVKLNSLLERNPKNRLVPSILLAGSTVNAFDDIGVGDPDFWYIQALGEAGIIPSKLSAIQSSLSNVDNSDSDGSFKFSPESFISRLYLVDWKAQLEYLLFPGTEEKLLKPDLFTVQISRKKVGFMDLGALTPDASPGLYMDMMAGDKAIARRVFGNSRRLQPYKPATIAQAAVALTSGRMVGAIHSELSRLEAENILRLAEMEEIRSDLIHRGEIHRFWEEKQNEEKVRGVEVQEAFLAALHDLEKERIARDVHLADYMKEKATLDCQRHLLLSLKDEVDGMRERLAYERANFVSEQQSLDVLFTDLRDQQDALFEAKSILEAEKEALRILRSWVEEEARQSQLRARVLEAAAQRWKWDNQSVLPQSRSSESGD